MPKGNCQVEGCPDQEHAKGLCGRHYGQQWRGRPVTTGPVAETREGDPNPLACTNLDGKLARAQRMYELVSGLEGRVRWRAEIRGLQAEIRNRQNQEELVTA